MSSYLKSSKSLQLPRCLVWLWQLWHTYFLSPDWQLALMLTGIVGAATHLLAIALYLRAPKIFRKLQYIIILMSYASIMILVGGIANTNSISIRLQTSTVAQLLVVATIYFQNSWFVLATSWAAYLVHIQITSTRGCFQRNELNTLYAQVCLGAVYTGLDTI